MADQSNQELLDALGVDAAPVKNVTRTAREERIIAGFEEIQRFVEQEKRIPTHGEEKDIFERLYATRLEQISSSEECRDLVLELDYQGLLDKSDKVAEPPADYDSDEELLAELGVEAPKEGDVTFLKHVKPRAEVRKAAEEIGTRTPCEDFETFKAIFEAVQEDLKIGRRKTLPFNKDGSIEEGNLFILSGQKALVASIGDQFISTDGRKEYRLRVIFDNGVESNQLMRSLQKRLWEDETGRRISDTSYGPLFDDVQEEDDLDSGTIYVLRSKLDHPTLNQSRDVIHKIGVTGGSVKKRIANVKLDPTFLMADVDIIATYELFNINRTKLESVLHKFFSNTRLDIQINDRFGNPVTPREWFLVPLFIIDEVVDKVKDGTIGEYVYDMETVSLVSIK